MGSYNIGLLTLLELEDTKQPHITDPTFKHVLSLIYSSEYNDLFNDLTIQSLGELYEEVHNYHTSSKTRQKQKGAYYTPQEVVEYMIDNSVQEYLETHKEADIRDVHILDPACGGGIFLLTAYNNLLDYYKQYYNSLIDKPANTVFNYNGELYLTIEEKKRILTSNIYGVDLDIFAVEITRQSLILQCWKDYNIELDHLINEMLEEIE